MAHLPHLTPLLLRAGLHKAQAEMVSDPRLPVPVGSPTRLKRTRHCNEVPGEIQEGWEQELQPPHVAEPAGYELRLRGRGSLGALLGIGRGRGTMPPPSNPPRATGLSNQLANPAKKATQADDNCQPMELEQSYSCSDSVGKRQGPRPFGGHRPGVGPVPSSVDTVVLLSGEQVYRGTPEQPILVYEKHKAENMARIRSWPSGAPNKLCTSGRVCGRGSS